MELPDCCYKNFAGKCRRPKPVHTEITQNERRPFPFAPLLLRRRPSVPSQVCFYMPFRNAFARAYAPH